MKIPLVNLKKQHEPLREQLNEAISSVIDRSAFIGSDVIADFEKAFAEFCGVSYAVGVSSGTDALFLALRAVGVHSDDLVITVPNTFIATAEAITMAGASPVFVDIDADTHNMSVDALAQALQAMSETNVKKVKVVIPVHLYGRGAPMADILEIAAKYNLKVISDAAQAHGGEYKGKKIAEWADVTCYSFYPGKNLGAFGDAGAVVTDDPVLAEQVRKLRNHGRSEKYEHELEGYNCRLDSIQAAVLNVKLPLLDSWNENRIDKARMYNELFGNVHDIICPFTDNGSKHVFHLYVIRHKDRDILRAELKKKGIASGIHYPIPLHLQPAYKYLGYGKGDFPVAERMASEILSLPMDGTITNEEVTQVVNAIVDVNENSVL